MELTLSDEEEGSLLGKPSVPGASKAAASSAAASAATPSSSSASAAPAARKPASKLKKTSASQKLGKPAKGKQPASSKRSAKKRKYDGSSEDEEASESGSEFEADSNQQPFVMASSSAAAAAAGIEVRRSNRSTAVVDSDFPPFQSAVRMGLDGQIQSRADLLKICRDEGDLFRESTLKTVLECVQQRMDSWSLEFAREMFSAIVGDGDLSRKFQLTDYSVSNDAKRNAARRQRAFCSTVELANTAVQLAVLGLRKWGVDREVSKSIFALLNMLWVEEDLKEHREVIVSSNGLMESLADWIHQQWAQLAAQVNPPVTESVLLLDCTELLVWFLFEFEDEDKASATWRPFLTHADSRGLRTVFDMLASPQLMAWMQNAKMDEEDVSEPRCLVRRLLRITDISLFSPAREMMSTAARALLQLIPTNSDLLIRRIYRLFLQSLQGPFATIFSNQYRYSVYWVVAVSRSGSIVPECTLASIIDATSDVRQRLIARVIKNEKLSREEESWLFEFLLAIHSALDLHRTCSPSTVVEPWWTKQQQLFMSEITQLLWRPQESFSTRRSLHEAGSVDIWHDCVR